MKKAILFVVLCLLGQIAYATEPAESCDLYVFADRYDLDFIEKSPTKDPSIELRSDRKDFWQAALVHKGYNPIFISKKDLFTLDTTSNSNKKFLRLNYQTRFSESWQP